MRLEWADPRVGHLSDDLDDAGDFERSLSHQHIQRMALHEFHGDVRQTVFRLTHIVDGADMRMIERRSRFGLDEESLSPARVRGKFRRQELDRGFTFQPGVLGQKNLSHAAGTKLVRDPIVANSLADHLTSSTGNERWRTSPAARPVQIGDSAAVHRPPTIAVAPVGHVASRSTGARRKDLAWY